MLYNLGDGPSPCANPPFKVHFSWRLAIILYYASLPIGTNSFITPMKYGPKPKNLYTESIYPWYTLSKAFFWSTDSIAPFTPFTSQCLIVFIVLISASWIYRFLLYAFWLRDLTLSTYSLCTQLSLAHTEYARNYFLLILSMSGVTSILYWECTELC